jgi:aerobic carbon-monoxide dehydrogenase large subunit
MNERERQKVIVAGSESWVGRSVPRRAMDAHTSGRGCFVDDITLPRMVYAAFVRSPHSHARIESINVSVARQRPGVVAVYTGSDIARICKPWVGVLTTIPGMRSAPQHPLPIDLATWQGEAVAIVLAESRAEAEDGCEFVEIAWQEIDPVVDRHSAMDRPSIHKEFDSNLCFHRKFETDGFDSAMGEADLVVERVFEFGRQTGVTLEPRSIIASFDSGRRALTVHQSHQAPYMVRDVLVLLFGLPDIDVRVITPDVGGGFGLKVHIYPDEIACVAASILLGRPVKYAADRLESFLSDIHAREHTVTARIGVRDTGEIIGFDVVDVAGIGPYSMYPRTSAMESRQIGNLVGAPYRHMHHRADLSAVFQNKAPTSQYRAVGHPLACAVTECLVDEVASMLRLDPVEMRMRNYIPEDGYPRTSPTGMRFEKLSLQRCMQTLLEAMRYDELRAENTALLAAGTRRGIGIATVVELSNPATSGYAAGGAPITSQDGATVRLEPSGLVTCLVSVGEHGQGTETIYSQIAATALGIEPSQVRIVHGDTVVTPFGGGAWGSRGAGIGGEGVLQAACALREHLLSIAAGLLGVTAEELSIAGGVISGGGAKQVKLSEIARMVYFNPQMLPPGCKPELVVTRHYTPTQYPLAFTNGIQASLVEVDPDTGSVKLLRHWVIEDCGRIINPMLVDGQLRGAVVQGIGSALYEEILYDENGQLLNGTFADYLVPMSAEMPDIEIRHVETPTETTGLGAKGAGEAGVCGAPAAILNAINDALKGLIPERIACTPVTPQVILEALGKVPHARH